MNAIGHIKDASNETIKAVVSKSSSLVHQNINDNVPDNSQSIIYTIIIL